MDIKVVKNIASKVAVSEAQVLLRWGLQYDFALLPLSQPRRRG
jgi:diketogulonate reductase-like aldo/keto reductase